MSQTAVPWWICRTWADRSEWCRCCGISARATDQRRTGPAGRPCAMEWLVYAEGPVAGHILLWREGERFVLLLPKALQQAMQKRLQMFVLRSKVTLRDASEDAVAIGITEHLLTDDAGHDPCAVRCRRRPAAFPSSHVDAGCTRCRSTAMERIHRKRHEGVRRGRVAMGRNFRRRVQPYAGDAGTI